MRLVAAILVLMVAVLGACSDDQPVSEHEFYSAVVECTEERTGVDYGEVPDDGNGLVTTVGKRTIDAALDGARQVYLHCLDELVDQLGPTSE